MHHWYVYYMLPLVAYVDEHGCEVLTFDWGQMGAIQWNFAISSTMAMEPAGALIICAEVVSGSIDNGLGMGQDRVMAWPSAGACALISIIVIKTREVHRCDSPLRRQMRASMGCSAWLCIVGGAGEHAAQLPALVSSCEGVRAREGMQHSSWPVSRHADGVEMQDDTWHHSWPLLR
jgi:hypothetical protein